MRIKLASLKRRRTQLNRQIGPLAKNYQGAGDKRNVHDLGSRLYEIGYALDDYALMGKCAELSLNLCEEQPGSRRHRDYVRFALKAVAEHR